MRYFVIVVLGLLSVSLFSQEDKDLPKGIRNIETSFTLGVGHIHVEEHSNDDNLDFLNYVDDYPEYLDFITMKFGLQFDYSKKMHADINLILLDDIMPDNYDISTYYLLNNFFGVGAGSMLSKYWISDYGKFHIDRNPDYYTEGGNYRQFEYYDLGFYVTPVYRPIYKDGYKIVLKMNVGMSSFMKEESTFYLKKKLSNKRILYDYNTKLAFQPYINPKIDLRLNLIKIKNKNLGLLLKSNYYFSKRSMNYDLSYQEWTSENAVNTSVNTLKHNYSRLEIDLGFYLLW